MSFKTFLALWLGKVTKSILSLFPQYGGFAAPGLLALRIDPNFVKNLGKQIPIHIMVSGTNGKTTTTRMIGEILKNEGISFLNNRTGSNLARGVASTLINQSSFSGKINPKVALWEVDEAALLSVVEQVNPKILVLTNLFRDQLDRYGEIDSITKGWRKVIKNLPKDSILIINADDPTLSLFSKKTTRCFPFGFSEKIILNRNPDHASDASFCPKCLKPLKYKSVSYSHVGIFNPCICGFTQAEKQVVVNKISQEKENLKITLLLNNQISSLILPLPGIFNAYNALAALAVAENLNLSADRAIRTLSNFRAAFGRNEKITIDGKTIKVLLIKNPTGFNQVIDVLEAKNKKLSLLIAINDKIADGRDVSWLWDANIEKLAPCIKTVIVSGTRAYDMALRLKYTNHIIHIIIQPNLQKAINALLNQKDSKLFVLPTYTAMLEIREILRKKWVVKSSWKD